MNILANFFPGYASSGFQQRTVSGVGATRTILAGESGTTFLFDRAAGIVYTLPAPQIGLSFNFITTVTISSNAATVITDASTTFMGGSVSLAPNSATVGLGTTISANGTSHVKIQSNGTTTGGILGAEYSLQCVSATLWVVQGTLIGSGTLATPFA